MSTDGYEYSVPVPDNAQLISKYGTPIPPSPSVLLEESRSRNLLLASHESEQYHQSLLLNTNDPLAMRLLLASATADSRNFKILSLEEVERLKREKSMLTGRIEAHIRKLALESKVRDASENLVKLHAQKNKRLSKQADDQLQKAMRKVDDLATDLWRLQRRETAIKEQLLEHMAGILACQVGEENDMPKSIPLLDFGEEHLYIDSTELIDATIVDDSPGIPEHEVLSKANGQVYKILRRVNKQILNLLGVDVDPYTTQTIGESIVDLCCDLENGFDRLQQQHTQYEQVEAVSKQTSEEASRELWATLGENLTTTPSNAQLLSKMHSIMEELKALQSECAESAAHVSDLEEQHAQAMEQLQNDYEKELGKAHSQVDSLREHVTSLEQERSEPEVQRAQLDALSSEHEAEKKSLHRELTAVQSSLSATTHAHSSLREEHMLLEHTHQQMSADVKKLNIAIRELKLQISEAESSSKDVMVSDFAMNNLTAEINALRESYDLAQAEIQDQKLRIDTERETSQREIEELSAQQNEADASIEFLQLENRKHHEQSDERYLLLQNQYQLLEQKHAATKAELTDCGRQLAIQQEAVANAHIYAGAETTRLSLQLADALNDLTQAGQKLHAKSLVSQGLQESLHAAEAKLQTMSKTNEDLCVSLERQQTLNIEAEQLQNLHGKCVLLQNELNSMLQEFEIMTRTSLAHEAERIKLEDRNDDLLERVLDLEREVADEKVRNISRRPTIPDDDDNDRPMSPTSTGENSATTNLRKEFRKLVQEMRLQHAKQARMDYTEIKRLERLVAGGGTL